MKTCFILRVNFLHLVHQFIQMKSFDLISHTFYCVHVCLPPTHAHTCAHTHTPHDHTLICVFTSYLSVSLLKTWSSDSTCQRRFDTLNHKYESAHLSFIGSRGGATWWASVRGGEDVAALTWFLREGSQEVEKPTAICEDYKPRVVVCGHHDSMRV